MKVPFSAFSSNAAAPTASEIADLLSDGSAWSVFRAGYMTGREVRVLPDGQKVCGILRLTAETEEDASALELLDYEDGSVTRAPGELDESFGQGEVPPELCDRWAAPPFQRQRFAAVVDESVQRGRRARADPARVLGCDCHPQQRGLRHHMRQRHRA